MVLFFGFALGPRNAGKGEGRYRMPLGFYFFYGFLFSVSVFFFFDEWDGMGWDGFFLCSDGCVRYEVLCYLPYRMIDENRIARL